MATQFAVDLVFKSQGGRQIQDVADKLQGLDHKSRGAQQSLDGASNSIRRTGKSAATASANIQRFGIAFRSVLGPLVGVFGAINLLSGSLKVLGDRQADLAVLRSGLQKVGADASELDRLTKAADEFGKSTLFDQEQFTRGFALLTSFQSIAVGSYTRVAEAAADVAQVTGQDLNSSLLQLAKALQDPERGLTALARSGTQFSESQKEVIKSLVEAGRIADAQRFILEEIERQYGNAARTAGKEGLAGQVDSLQESFRDFQEALATGVVPAVSAFLQGATGLLGVLSQIPTPVGQFALAAGGAAAAIWALNAAINAFKATRLASFLVQQAALFQAFGAKIYFASAAQTAMAATTRALSAALAAAPWAAAAAALALLVSETWRAWQAHSALNQVIREGNYEQLKQRLSETEAEIKKLESASINAAAGMSLLGGAAELNAVKLAQLRDTARQLREALSGKSPTGGGKPPAIPSLPTISTGGRSKGGGGGGGDPKADLKAAQGQLRTLQQQLAMSQAKAGLDSEVLRISQEYENSLKRIGELKDQSLAKELQSTALQLRNQQINSAVQKAAEDRAKTVADMMGNLDRELAGMRAVTVEQQRELQLQDLIKQAQDNKVKLTEDEIAKLRDKLKLLDEERNKRAILEFQQQTMNDLVNNLGKQFSSLFETLITDTNNWRQALTGALKQLSGLLLNAGFKMLGGSDGKGLFSILSGNFGGARAAGGPVSSGKSYLVGEKGPELFTPGRSGMIHPNGAGGEVNSVVNITITDSGTQVDNKRASELGRLVETTVVGVIQRERRPGGMLSR